MHDTNKPIRKLESRPATDEELFYLKIARDEFTASLSRIEETAKYIIGAVGAVAGLFLAGLQVKIAIKPDLKGDVTAIPFWLWGVSLLCAIFVILPLPYRHAENAPLEIRRSIEKSRWVKWILLLISAIAFASGLLVAANVLKG
jgi:hypothetical protein